MAAVEKWQGWFVLLTSSPGPVCDIVVLEGALHHQHVEAVCEVVARKRISSGFAVNCLC